MDDYIKANKKSWGSIAEAHYHTFRNRLSKEESTLSRIQREESGDIRGKSLIHLQCNTGADTVSLARMGARITGVDLAPENIQFARKLAVECGFHEALFIEANVLELMQTHDRKYDIVYTTEGVLCWLPDLELWARNVRHLMKDDGFLYLLDSHPFFMLWDEDKLPELSVKYPYFQKTADKDEWTGGYACEPRKAVNYSWMYTVGELINALSKAGLHIEWFHEFDGLYYRLAGEKQERDGNGHWVFPEHRGKLPFTFSLKAVIR
jgi:SAM-dependent methyltransferase